LAGLPPSVLLALRGEGRVFAKHDSPVCVGPHFDGLTGPRAPLRGSGDQDEATAIGDGEVGGALGQGKDPTAEAVGDRLEERLADALLKLPSHRPPRELPELGVAVRVVRRDAELAERVATP